MKKKLFFKRFKKFFILPLFVFVFLVSLLCVNADTLIYQSNPFIIQGTATDNGESIADVTPQAFLFEKRGHSEVVNNEIVNADGQYLVNIGRQQWDEEWELGEYDNGVKLSLSDRIRSKNYIRVIPGIRYYFYFPIGSIKVSQFDIDKNFIKQGLSSSTSLLLESNCHYITFNMNTTYGVEYNDDITISIYYDDEDGYDQYYPYHVVSQVDTGTETLRSAGSVYDVKTPDGTITRNVGSVDLGTLEWEWQSANNRWASTGLSSLAKLPLDNLVIANILSENYQCFSAFDSIGGAKGLALTASGSIIVYNNDSANSPTGTLYYELATPTTDQGTSYSQNYYVDDFGSQYWLNSEEEFVVVGQAGLYGYQFDFVYSWFESIVRFIAETIKELGSSVLNYIKTGFNTLFINQVEVEVDGQIVIQNQPSELVWYVFALMGISLLLGLVYYLVNMLRRSR